MDAADTFEPVENLTERLGARYPLNGRAGVNPIKDGRRAGGGGGIADIAVRNLRRIDAVARIEAKPAISKRVIDGAEARTEQGIVGHLCVSLIDAGVLVVAGTDIEAQVIVVIPLVIEKCRSSGEAVAAAALEHRPPHDERAAARKDGGHLAV